jgi:glycosyltransferase involved in cell wall biosynthesis
MVSVVIAAYNEARVLGGCLDALFADRAGGLDVTVVANGCTDQTAAVARARPGVRVIELAEASKPAALNAGDAAAVGFPRVYLDGDIPLSGAAVRALAAALPAGGPALVAIPRRALVLASRPLLVRAYYAVHARLPVFATGLFGRGAIAMSEAGRARFDRFPDLIADDLFLDSLFSRAERVVVDAVAAPVGTPLRTADLVRRLVRVRAGNAAMRAAGPGIRPAARLSWLTDVILPRPWLAPAAVCYVGLTVTAALLARRRSRANHWGRDESSRAGVQRAPGRLSTRRSDRA